MRKSHSLPLFFIICAVSQIIKNIMLLSYKLPLKVVIFYG